MLALDTSSKLAQALLQYQLDKLPIDYIEKRNAIVDAVTLDDAKKAAQRLWGQGLLTVIVGRAPQGRRPARRGAAKGELTRISPSWPGIAVRTTASLRSPLPGHRRFLFSIAGKT
jgi:hypothetical protein